MTYQEWKSIKEGDYLQRRTGQVVRVVEKLRHKCMTKCVIGYLDYNLYWYVHRNYHDFYEILSKKDMLELL